jgi:hypothetical protein
MAGDITTLLVNDDVTVLGPPSVIDVVLDFGATGQRGSKYFVGVGDPNSHTSGGQIFSQQLFLNDMYINTSTGSDYGYMYQYVSEPGGDTWVPVLAVNPVVYSVNYETDFVSGSGLITIPISNIVTSSGTTLTAENFNVQYSIVHSAPTASSISSISIVGTDLKIQISAVKYSSSTWSSFNVNDVIVHTFITMVGV